MAMMLPSLSMGTLAVTIIILNVGRSLGSDRHCKRPSPLLSLSGAVFMLRNWAWWSVTTLAPSSSMGTLTVAIIILNSRRSFYATEEGVVEL